MRDPRPVLSIFYAAQLGHLGIILPFMALWLHHRGFTATGIGMMMALLAAFKFGATVWGKWADRTGRRKGLLVVAAAMAAFSLAAATQVEQLLPLVLLMAIYGFTRAPLLPFAEATALEQSELRRFKYGKVRLWGSVSFIVFSGGFGLLATSMSLDAGMAIGAVLLGLVALAALWFPLPAEPFATLPSNEHVASPSVWQGRIPFLGACVLMQASHGAYYSFYSIKLEDLGYSAAAIGSLWALAVLCEVLLLARIDDLVDRFGSYAVLRVCLIVAAVRWVLIGSVASAGLLILGQVMHAATYAGFHVAAIRVVFKHSGQNRAREQALYSGLTYGLGIFAGSLITGLLVARLGLSTIYIGSAVLALLALPLLGASRQDSGNRAGGLR
jgi:PPP family 3-phenylpropionic acid transporter